MAEEKTGHKEILVILAIYSIVLSGLLTVIVKFLPIYCYTVCPLLIWGFVKSYSTLAGEKNNNIYSDINSSGNEIKVCVVGAGFSGICMGIKLKKMGVKYRILEKGSDVGGTWHLNRYPGCRADVWSLVYQIYDFMNPNWTSYVAPGEEIRDYMKNAVKHFNLEPHISFDTAVKKASWQEEQNLWQIETNHGEVINAPFLVSGCGILHKAIIPNIKGLHKFQGTVFHSSFWEESHDYKGKKVAIVGTGASGAQIAPTIADEVKELYVFQRTANWVLPKIHEDFPKWYNQLMAKIPCLMTFLYWSLIVAVDIIGPLWLSKGLTSRFLQWKLKRNMAAQLKGNKELIEKMTPNFELGCKRVLLTNDYLPMFVSNTNVHLVTENIVAVDETGIQTVDGKHYQVDLIVFATGYHIEESICGFEAVGKNGVVLRDYLDKYPAAFKGMSVPNFPNFFLLLGPNSVLAQSSLIYIIECQANYIGDCLRKMHLGNFIAIDVKEEKTRDYRKLMDHWSANRNYTGSCQGWFKNKDGINFIIWPKGLLQYWLMTRKADLETDYNLTVKT